MSSPPLITGPVPAYTNPPIEPQFYSPSRFVISSITLGLTTTIETIPTVINGISVSMNYVIGQVVRFFIPQQYGTQQLSGRQGNVISLPTPLSIEVDIDSSQFNQFKDVNYFQKPQVIAIGDINQGNVNDNPNVQKIYIPGSFINIS